MSLLRPRPDDPQKTPKAPSTFRATFGIRWRWLGVLPVIFAALVPFFVPRLPISTDGRFHLFRLVELDWLVRQGVLWPRYAPDMAYGYGYPLFNYYAPLVYYFGVGLHWLGLDFVPALLALLGGSIVLGAMGVYKLADEFFGKTAGYIAAAVFAFAPYTLINALSRSTVAEVMSVAWLPWVLWTLQRAFRRRPPMAWAGLGVSYAILLIIHNLSAVAGTAILSAVAGFEMVSLCREHGSARGVQLSMAPLLALGCGLLLAAFFWVPAFFETSAVQLQRFAATGDLDFHRYFLSLGQLLSPPQTFDPRLEFPAAPMALGISTLGLAAVGVLAARRYPSVMRWRLWFLAAILLGLIGLTLPLSLPVWEHLTPLRLFQFPWRFLGPASVIAAILAGASFGAWPPQTAASRWHWLLPSATLVVIVVSSLTWTFVGHLPPINQPGLVDLQKEEVRSGNIGTTTVGEYLPAAVVTLPPADRLMAQYASQSPQSIDRLDRESLPAFVQVRQLSSGVLSLQAAFTAPKPFTASVLWFYFPGWQAELDGRAIAIVPSVPNGFITVVVPAGDHTLRLYFGTTPLRQLAGALSVLGLFGLVGLFLVGRRWQRGEPRLEIEKPPEPGMAPRLLLALALVGAGLGIGRIYLGDHNSSFRSSRFDGQRVAGAEQDLDINFGEIMNLIGRDSPSQVAADQPIGVMLYWRSYGQPDKNYSVGLQLVDAAGHTFGQQDSYHPGGYPTSNWQPENYAPDLHLLRAYPGTPPGTYYLRASVYPEGGGTALNASNADSQPLGNTVEVATVTLTAPSRPATAAELAPQHLLQQSLGPLTLIGLDQPAVTVNSGDLLPLVFYWRVTDDLVPALEASLELRGADDTVVLLEKFALGPAAIPEADWRSGATWRVPRDFILPPTVPAGSAQLQIRLTATDGQGWGPVVVGDLIIVTPQRQFNTPPMRVRQEYQFGPSFRLLGFDHDLQAAQPGQPMTVTLYWQATAITTQTCKIFVHVVDGAGQIVVQNDAAPAGGTRPTTGWLPPEVITDAHTLVLPAGLPPGRYILRIGMYNSQTQQRLLILDATQAPVGDFVDLEPFQVGLP